MLQNEKRYNIKKYGALFLVLFFLFINMLNNYKYRELCIIISLISSIVLIYKSRKEVGSTVVFIFLFLSILKIAPEYLFGVKTTAYSYYYNNEAYNITISIIMIYVTIVAIFYRERRTKIISENLNGNNNILFFLLYIVCIYILLYGINRSYNSSYTVSIKTIYEYFVMVYCFAYYYSPKSKTTNALLLILAFIYILQDFFYGGRISSVQLIILIVVLFFNKLRFKGIIMFSIFGYIVMNVVEVYRISYSVSNINITAIISSILYRPIGEYKWNTFSEVLYSSSALIYTKMNIFSSQDTLKSFLDFIVNIFIGGERVFGNIVAYISINVSKVGGGGFLPVYFYFWLGWGGVFFISWLTTKLINLESSNKSKDYNKILYILVLAMFPRWYLYTPLILFRYLILNYTIVYIILKYVNQLMKWQKNQIDIKHDKRVLR